MSRGSHGRERCAKGWRERKRVSAVVLSFLKRSCRCVPWTVPSRPVLSPSSWSALGVFSGGVYRSSPPRAESPVVCRAAIYLILSPAVNVEGESRARRGETRKRREALVDDPAARDRWRVFLSFARAREAVSACHRRARRPMSTDK